MDEDNIIIFLALALFLVVIALICLTVYSFHVENQIHDIEILETGKIYHYCKIQQLNHFAHIKCSDGDLRYITAYKVLK